MITTHFCRSCGSCEISTSSFSSNSFNTTSCSSTAISSQDFSRRMVDCNTSCFWRSERLQHACQVQRASHHSSIPLYACSKWSRCPRYSIYTTVWTLEVCRALRGQHRSDDGEWLSRDYQHRCPSQTCHFVSRTGNAANVIFARKHWSSVSLFILVANMSQQCVWSHTNFVRSQ